MPLGNNYTSPGSQWNTPSQRAKKSTLDRPRLLLKRNYSKNATFSSLFIFSFRPGFFPRCITWIILHPGVQPERKRVNTQITLTASDPASHHSRVTRQSDVSPSLLPPASQLFTHLLAGAENSQKKAPQRMLLLSSPHTPNLGLGARERPCLVPRGCTHVDDNRVRTSRHGPPDPSRVKLNQTVQCFPRPDRIKLSFNYDISGSSSIF